MRSFSRYHKYTLGADLRNGARRVLKPLVRALARGHAMAVVRETGERPAGCHGRRPVALLVPDGTSREHD
jgi:hypothetical protein